MITFRFYLISVISFFLALTIGIVMGTTVIDKAVVDGLQSRINSVANNADKRRHVNDKYQDYINAVNTLDIDNITLDANNVYTTIYYSNESEIDVINSLENYLKTFNVNIVDKKLIPLNKKSDIGLSDVNLVEGTVPLRIFVITPTINLTKNYIEYLKTVPNLLVVSTVPSHEELEGKTNYDSVLKKLKNDGFKSLLSSVNSTFGRVNLKNYLKEKLNDPAYQNIYFVNP